MYTINHLIRTQSIECRMQRVTNRRSCVRKYSAAHLLTIFLNIFPAHSKERHLNTHRTRHKQVKIFTHTVTSILCTAWSLQVLFIRLIPLTVCTSIQSDMFPFYPAFVRLSFFVIVCVFRFLSSFLSLLRRFLSIWNRLHRFSKQLHICAD